MRRAAALGAPDFNAESATLGDGAGTGGTGGAVIGAYYGGPIGAPIGGAIGAKLGSIFDQKEDCVPVGPTDGSNCTSSIARAKIDQILNERYTELMNLAGDNDFLRDTIASTWPKLRDCIASRLYLDCNLQGFTDDDVCSEHRHWDSTPGKEGCKCDSGYMPDPAISAAGGGSSPCVPEGNPETVALIVCLGKCGDGEAGKICGDACRAAHPNADLSFEGGGGGDSGGSGVGTVVALGAGALALYAGVQMFRGKPLW